MRKLGISLLVVGSAATVGACGGDSACDLESPGTICTLAGSGENGYDQDADELAIPALETKFSLPQDTLTAPSGEVFIVDWNNHRLRKFDPTDGTVKWVSGRGELGGNLDDPANGDFNHPTNVIFDANGDLIIAAWHNSMLRTIDLDNGTVTDRCGDGKRAYFGDDASALNASLDLPASIAFDPAGNLTIMDQANQVLRYIDTDDNIHHLAGQCVIDAPEPNGPGPCAEGVAPIQCPSGNNGPSGKFTCGALDTCTKPCTPGYAGDAVPATEMRMSQPFGQSAQPAGRIAYDASGNLYFADTSNHLIRMIDTDGIVHRVAGLAPVDGVPQSGYAGDGGQALDALINFPVDIAIGDDGTVYFSDVRNNCIRGIGTDGVISTVVGICGEKGYDGDGGPATEATLNLVFGVEYYEGRLNIADTGNSVIRTVLLP